jgi:hypothetical protein
VDWTKCDTPIAAPANKSPGPKFLNFEIIGYSE